MAHPSRPGADDAYARALSAYEEKAYDVARRWVLEALAHDRQHAGARALLTRLDSARQASRPLEPSPRGSEVVSVDPTVLVSRASASEPIEPTVMIQREEPRRRPSNTDTHEIIRPSRRPTAQPVPEATIVQPKKRTAPSRTRSSASWLASIGGAVGAWFPARGRAGRTRSTDRSAVNRHSGVLIALATFAIGALLVWGVFVAVRWLWLPGELLTVTKPTGGTIVGPGIECGTQGSKCSTRLAIGETVQLEARPDNGYAFTAFTGDCAPTGRSFMTEARTCGATFGAVAAAAAPVTFRLTIQKPEGGSIVEVGLGILCGTLGNTCSADVRSGVPVALRAQADDGYTWEQFTGDCPATGETTMTAALTCGATFVQTSAPLANRGPDRGSIAPPRPRPRPADSPRPAPSVPQSAAVQNPAPAPPASTPPLPTTTEAPTVAPEKPVARPQTPEEHAKEEIQQLIKNYCVALESLKPDRVRRLFHLDNESELKKRFREVRSLRCIVTSPPEYDRIDASPAGAAQVRFGMKQELKMASGGAPSLNETMVTMTVSRKDFQSAWLIDRVEHLPKPK